LRYPIEMETVPLFGSVLGRRRSDTSACPSRRNCRHVPQVAGPHKRTECWVRGESLNQWIDDRTDPAAKLEAAEETADWKKEKVSIAGAYGGERVPAYVFTPKNTSPPYQTVIYFTEPAPPNVINRPRNKPSFQAPARSARQMERDLSRSILGNAVRLEESADWIRSPTDYRVGKMKRPILSSTPSIVLF